MPAASLIAPTAGASPQRPPLYSATASDSFEARLGERPNWAELYDSKEWVAMGEARQVNLSEVQQRHHFVTFFPAIHLLRHSPSSSLPLFHTMRAVRHLLGKLSSIMWFQVLRKVRTRCAFRRHIKQCVSQLRKERGGVLEGWLTFWRTAEIRAAVDVRKQIQAAHPTVTSPSLQAKMALRRSMVVTPDAVKVEVLWQLYWLLHTLVAQRTKAFWDRWRGLLQLQEELRNSPPKTFQVDFSPAGAPQTLRAVTAAIFLQGAQRPQRNYPTGRDITFKELLRLTDCFNAMPDWVELQSTASISSTMAGFLTSPLCTDPQWMAYRYGQPFPLIPKCTWTPVLRHPLSLRFAMHAAPDDADPRSPVCISPLSAPSLSLSWSQKSSPNSPLQPLSEAAISPGTSPEARWTLSPARPVPALNAKSRSSLPRGQLRPWMLLPGLLRRSTAEPGDLYDKLPEPAACGPRREIKGRP